MLEKIAENPDWWPHRYDPMQDQIHFIKANRDDHRAAVFLTDEYLKNSQSPRAVKRSLAVAHSRNAPLHFIFHSGYCCSTLLARAFDLPGISMGLKEPVILNDIVGWKARGAETNSFREVLNDSLSLLANPFGPNEAVIVKPSSLINAIAPDVMSLRPDVKALFLYAPLEDFLGSIARKGLLGRLWVRELLSKQLRDGLIDLGLADDDYLRLTDLQATAVSWLTQQSLFQELQRKVGNSRLIAVDSATLMKSPEQIMRQISDHFALTIEDEKIHQLVAGPVFQKHSKTSANFDRDSRELDRTYGHKLYADEIEKVHAWATIIARNNGISLILPR